MVCISYNVRYVCGCYANVRVDPAGGTRSCVRMMVGNHQHHPVVGKGNPWYRGGGSEPTDGERGHGVTGLWPGDGREEEGH